MDHPYTSPIVRKIWGKSDTVLLIFAGAAAEFALNKAVDWLYYTGKLPADPIERLFSTVEYAGNIIFSDEKRATAAIDSMRQIHNAVESSRGAKIPDWAYRDVLYMLIYYSVAAFELLERNLSKSEKEELATVFLNVGRRMGIEQLPSDYDSWWSDYQLHLHADLHHSTFTDHLFAQYKKHLGTTRYFILKEAQKALVTNHVRKLLNFNKPAIIKTVIPFYKMARFSGADQMIKSILLPARFKERIYKLNRQHT